jgi:hypothetical protein
MKFLNKLIKNQTKFQRVFGLTIKQLNLLVKRIEPLWIEAEEKRLTRSNRKRGIGAGRPYSLVTLEQKVMVVLMYYRQYTTQEVLGLITGIDQGTISRLLQKMLPLIEKAADASLKTYLEEAKANLQRKRISDVQDFLTQYPDLADVSTDATEQECYRATNYEEQKKHYSGKTKQHAMKTQISVSASGRILDVSESYPGSVHDKTIMDQEKTVAKFHEKVPQRHDSGYSAASDTNIMPSSLYS